MMQHHHEFQQSNPSYFHAGWRHCCNLYILPEVSRSKTSSVTVSDTKHKKLNSLLINTQKTEMHNMKLLAKIRVKKMSGHMADGGNIPTHTVMTILNMSRFKRSIDSTSKVQSIRKGV